MSERKARRAEIKQSLINDIKAVDDLLSRLYLSSQEKKDAPDMDDLVDLFIGSIKGKIDTLSRILEDIKP